MTRDAVVLPTADAGLPAHAMEKEFWQTSPAAIRKAIPAVPVSIPTVRAAVVIMVAVAAITMTMTAVVEATEILIAVAAAITVRVRQDHVHQDHVRQNHVHRDHVHRDHARQDRVRHALTVRTAAVSSTAAA